MINVDDFEFRPREPLNETKEEYERERIENARIEYVQQLMEPFPNGNSVEKETIWGILELLEDMLNRRMP